LRASICISRTTIKSLGSSLAYYPISLMTI
jgi:hypothetical protein